MPFVIIDKDGQPLTDASGELVVLASLDEALKWVGTNERAEPWSPDRISRWKAERP
jgi:hypothetical protein